MTFRDFKRINVEGAHLCFLLISAFSVIFFSCSQHLNMKNKILVHKNCAVSSAFIQKKKKRYIIIKIFILMALLHT